ncbi:hypothetical protein D3C87_1352090 [compost metagenome]
MRHVLEQADQVYLLLIVAAQRAARLLAHDGHDRLVVQLGVVQPVQQVDGARPGRGQAHADLPREFGVGAGHEGRAFFVACLDEFQFLVFPKRADQAVDAIAGIAEHTLHAPFAQAGEDKIGNGFHVGAPCGQVLLNPSTGRMARHTESRIRARRNPHSRLLGVLPKSASPQRSPDAICCAAPKFTNASKNASNPRPALGLARAQARARPHPAVLGTPLAHKKALRNRAHFFSGPPTFPEQQAWRRQFL